MKYSQDSCAPDQPGTFLTFQILIPPEAFIWALNLTVYPADPKCHRSKSVFKRANPKMCPAGQVLKHTSIKPPKQEFGTFYKPGVDYVLPK